MIQRLDKILLLVSVLFAMLLFIAGSDAYAFDKTSNGSGNWSVAGNWAPAGVPAPGDQVLIRSGDSLLINESNLVKSLTILPGGVVSMLNGKSITVSGNLTVNGKMTMNGGDINFPINGASFEIGNGGTFTWEPYTNNSAGASLFMNGAENFSPSSTLIIKKWFNYQVPLGSVITGDFGNLTLNSIDGNFLTEWDQNNEFEKHPIRGTLVIDHGWIVLDKSGSISNTTIGSVSLLNADSYFDLHSGNHSGSFSFQTGSISIVAGLFNGIYDGDGNVSISVAGNVTISSNGYFFPIYNDGVEATGRGNATLTVGGTFTQTSGDFRGIYNITVKNAGTVQLKFGNLSVTGGIFMGHYGCNVSGGLNTIEVTGDLYVHFDNALDKFRAVGLSELSGTLNSGRLQLKIGGTLTTSGNTLSEFCSQVGSGEETVVVSGPVKFEGCTNNFAYGVPRAAHPFNLAFSGNVTISNGTVYLSKIGGNGSTTIGGNLNITGGSLIANGSGGSHTLNVIGNFNQSNGTFYFHNNLFKPTNEIINTNITGSFTQSGGTLIFDDNNDPGSAAHILTLTGESCNLAGNGIIMHAGEGTGNVFGIINFSRQGVIGFSRTSNTHHLQQVRQIISAGCIIDVTEGNVQVASHQHPANDFLTVSNGGILQMNNGQIVSNGNAPYSGIKIEAGGTIKLKGKTGLYDGTPSGTISSSVNMDFDLADKSIVEYNGNDNQIITGIGAGIANSEQHKYGILKINFSGTADEEFVYPQASNLFIRTKLVLESGEFNLNGKMVTIESGEEDAISRNTGYIRSESIPPQKKGFLKWMNIKEGNYVFPFGVNSKTFIPLNFSPFSGIGYYVSASTNASSENDNTAGLNHQTTDRSYEFDAPGFMANVNIYWSDPSVNNHDTYTLERSNDGKNFEALNAVSDTGSGNLIDQYHREEITLVPGTSFYRLKQASGVNGSSVSKIAIVRFSGNSIENSPIQQESFEVYPNPFKSNFSIKLIKTRDEEVTIQIISCSGQLVYSRNEKTTIGINYIEFTQVEKLPPGIYLLNISGRGTKMSKKIIKLL